MESHAGAVSSIASAAPPHRGVGLSLRLGFLVTLVVTVAMAALSGAQLAFELRAEQREQQKRLGESLVPLAAELKLAPTREVAANAIDRIHASYAVLGRFDHHLAVVDASGRIVLTTRIVGGPSPSGSLIATVPMVAPALGPGTYALNVTADGPEFQAARDRRWRDWASHVGVTASLILALLFVVIRREVTEPIGRLLKGVRKMELGYWDDMPDPGGAWEIRWLGWRFRTLGEELRRTVEHLVAAQRRAYSMDRGPDNASETATEETSPPQSSLDHPDSGAAVLRLHARLECLQRANPGDPECRRLAQWAWDNDATQAETLGQPELRVRLEDAALHVLDPGAFLDISRRIEAERPRLEALAVARGEEINRALTAQNIPVVEIRHRVKHPAGIWKKMLDKNLVFDQVHDLLALRIVVPAEADCYHALGVIHDIYAPIVGRFKDYVALPKSNGYRSLHASVRDLEGVVFEVQIRSIAMHRHAEQGAAAHAGYKNATRIPMGSKRAVPWKRFLGIGRQLCKPR
jgi:HAMP domain-containing protein